MSKNSDIITDFIAAWKEKDVDKIMSFFTPDCVYHNIPMEPLKGTEAIRGLKAGHPLGHFVEDLEIERATGVIRR